MLLIPALVFVCIASLWLVAVFKPKPRPAAWLVFFMLSYANIVLIGEVASLLGLLNQIWFFLLGHTLIALGAALIWWRAGRPDLFAALIPPRERFSVAHLRGFIQAHPDLALLSLTILLALLYSAVLILVVPPNNNDALRYHLARVGYWLQHGSLAPWPTSMVQLIYPPVDAQLNFLWLMLLSSTDKLVGFVQWLTVLISAIGVYGLATLLGWEKPRAYFAALVLISYPSVLLQATTAQIDMITTALFVGVVYFFMRAFALQEKQSLYFSALAFGLGLGTKQTFFYLIPVAGILFIAVLIKYRQVVIKPMLQWAAALVLAYAAFGLYSNIINLQAFGNPLAPRETVNYISRVNDPAYMVRSLGYNIPRMLYNSLDTSGLPRPLDGYVHKIKAYTASFLFGILHYDIEGTDYTFFGFPFKFIDKNQNQEDNAWFGPLSVLLLLPAMVYQFIVGLRTRDPYRLALVLMVPAFLFVQNLLWPNWSPYNGRYYAPVIATATPLIAGFNWKGKHGRILRWLAVGLAVVIIFVTVLYNPAKQTLGKQAKWVDIWTADRATALTIQDYANRDMMRLIQDRVPAQATLGVAHVEALNEYGLFGEGLTRRLIQVYPIELLSEARWLEERGIQYLLVERSPDIPAVSDTFKLIAQVEGWSLYQHR